MLPSSLLVVMALAAPNSPGAASLFLGTARATPDGPVLYREQHYSYGPAGHRHTLVLYRCPDGQPFARKITDQAGSLDPDFALVDDANGYREGVRTRDGQREVYVRRVGASQTRSAPLPKVSKAVIDSGFNAFVHDHWQALVKGRTLSIEFLVPSRRKFMGFRVARHDDPKAAAKGQVVLRLELDRWFAFALPHIDVGYDAKTRALLWFRGLSNLRDRQGKNVRVVLDYPPDQRDQPVTAAQLQQARSVPLTGRCRLD